MERPATPVARQSVNIHGYAFGFVCVARLEVRIHRERCGRNHFPNVRKHVVERKSRTSHPAFLGQKPTPAEVVANASNPRW